MLYQRLERLPETAVAQDTETHLIQAGLGAPPMVCLSKAEIVNGAIVTALAGGDDAGKANARQMFRDALAADKILVGANISYDLAVMAVDLAKQGVDVMPEIFAMTDGPHLYDSYAVDCRVYDIQHAQALDAIAEGYLGRDPRPIPWGSGGELKDPITGKGGRYSLAIVTDLVLGRKDAKANDEWRMRYAELDGIPVAQWPEKAVTYPQDDVKNTLEVALAQCGFWERTGMHEQGDDGVCVHCGATNAGTCSRYQTARNLQDLGNQTSAAFALWLGAVHGFLADQSYADVIEKHCLRDREHGIKPFIEAGLVRENSSENRSELKRRIALAYGATQPCDQCGGTGKVLSPRAKPTRCRACKPKKASPPNPQCPDCQGDGVATYGPWNNCVGPHDVKTCDGTGLKLTEAVPLSKGEGIAYGRDILHESEDLFLMSYGDHLKGAKYLGTYLPYFRRARVCLSCAQHGTEKFPHLETCAYQGTGKPAYRSVPLTLRPNPILETGRVSYDEVIQLLPREAGYFDEESKIFVPSLREIIHARARRVFSSEDFKAGELYTHAQSCIWLLGFSDLGDALLNDIDPHSKLAASVLSMTYDAFYKMLKDGDRTCKAGRQAAKPFTFGKPGGMGDVKLVQQQRKQGPDTPCEMGPSWIEIDDKPMRGYNGLRFCILMDGAKQCGFDARGNSNKVVMWGKRGYERKISPTCSHCLECASRLGAIWMDEWRENRPYRDFVSEAIDHGMVIEPEALERWPHLKQWFTPGQQLARGEIMQHVSGRIRQVSTDLKESPFCAASNGFFQGLLGDIAKSAARRVVRECYDRTWRVPRIAHPNSRPSKYGGIQSPLFGSRMIGFFHDELFCEHPEEMGHDGATRVSEIMEEEIRWYCPDVAATAGAEPTLMRRWYKGAEPRWARGGKKAADENDRLVCWEPTRKQAA